MELREVYKMESEFEVKVEAEFSSMMHEAAAMPRRSDHV